MNKKLVITCIGQNEMFGLMESYLNKRILTVKSMTDGCEVMFIKRSEMMRTIARNRLEKFVSKYIDEFIEQYRSRLNRTYDKANSFLEK